MGASDDTLAIDKAIRAYSSDLQQIARDLLVYKALFQGEWFAALARALEGTERETLHRIHAESIEEARGTLRALQDWDNVRGDGEEIVPLLRARMLADLLHIKESTTEAFLLTGMRAPTEALRRAFLDLADMDREHADALRDLLGKTRVLATDVHRRAATREGGSAGAYEGRAGAFSLRSRIEGAIQDLRSDGQEPKGLVLSAVGLRHLRDEGLLATGDGTAFGLPVEVDLGWRGECFCVVTNERVTLAELLSAGATRSP